jgi:hypothetical protein
MKVKQYQAICIDEKGNGFRVNGAISQDMDEAIRLAKKHSSFQDPKTRILRIEEWEVWEEDINRPIK